MSQLLEITFFRTAVSALDGSKLIFTENDFFFSGVEMVKIGVRVGGSKGIKETQWLHAVFDARWYKVQNK